MDFKLRILEGKNMVNLEEVIKQIKKFAQEFKSKNGDSALPSNKDFNLWIVGQFLELRQEVATNKAKIKMLCWAFASMIPLFIFIITLIR